MRTYNVGLKITEGFGFLKLFVWINDSTTKYYYMDDSGKMKTVVFDSKQEDIFTLDIKEIRKLIQKKEKEIILQHINVFSDPIKDIINEILLFDELQYEIDNLVDNLEEILKTKGVHLDLTQ